MNLVYPSPQFKPFFNNQIIICNRPSQHRFLQNELIQFFNPNQISMNNNVDYSTRWGSLWMAFPSVSAPHFLCISLFMCIVSPLLRRAEVSILWSSFFLSFIWSVNCILGIPSFGANMHLSVSAYHLCSFVTWLPYLG